MSEIDTPESDMPPLATMAELNNYKAALRGDAVALTGLADRHLPELLDEVSEFIADQEAKIAPARRLVTEIKNELARRLDAQKATQLKIGGYVVRFERIPAKASVRESVLREPGLLEELRDLVPGKVLDKAITIKLIPVTIEFRTHLTYLRKFGECGERATEILKRLVDEGVPGRRLVVERDEIRVGAK